MAGIYLHIPFCRQQCHYCDFYRVVSHGDNSLFIDALKKEMIIRKDYLAGSNVSTVYFGGGTPSLLKAEETASILDHIRNLFRVDSEAEITLEVNPDDVSHKYMKDLHRAGVNRISIGIQSFRDEDLKLMNRRHTADQGREALDIIRKSGFDNVSADLIYGIPGMGTENWAANIDEILSFDIRHLSAYHLSIEPGTVFFRMKEKGQISEVDEDESTAEFNLLLDKTGKAGFINYEISNFGKPGYFSIHNTNYWKQVPYLGLGPSAHSYNGYSRQWNISDVKNYIRSVNAGKPLFEKEELDIRTKFNEYVMTSLRTMWGIDLLYVERIFEKEGYDYVVNLSGKFIDYGLMRQDNNNLFLTSQGMMISDNIISEFIMPSP
ncbi:MAG TPA: radical SAM family heme chaperone HemW [Bacteroidales bacterium]|nr:radical SAM family heme chaperone HemW [Bacteroidales bacterium]HQJ80955.1 radical SAM family heme chaperone HemW [Bacteroidales bacterium]